MQVQGQSEQQGTEKRRSREEGERQMGKGKRKGRLAPGHKSERTSPIPATMHRRADLILPRQHTGADPVVRVTGETALRA